MLVFFFRKIRTAILTGVLSKHALRLHILRYAIIDMRHYKQGEGRKLIHGWLICLRRVKPIVTRYPAPCSTVLQYSQLRSVENLGDQ